MSEQPRVRARLQPERFHPDNFLKNYNYTSTNAVNVVEEEPESAESQDEYSDLDFLTVFSLARFSYGLFTMAKTKRLYK